MENIFGGSTNTNTLSLIGPVMRLEQKYYAAHFKSGKIVQGMLLDKSIDRKNFILSFNEKGEKTEEEYFYDGGESIKNVFNEKGLLVEIEYYDKGDLMEKSTYNYNDKGIQTGEIFIDAKTNEKKERVYENDENSKLNKEGKFIDSNGGFDSVDKVFDCVEYEHDEYGNWLTMFEYREKIPVFMCIRTINYFGVKAKKLTALFSIKSFPYTIENKIEKKSGVPDEKIIDILSVPLCPDDTQFTESQSDWLAKSGEYILRAQRYFVLRNGKLPFSVAYKERDIEVIALLCELITHLGAQIIFSSERTSAERDEIETVNYVLRFPDLGYLLAVGDINCRNKNNFLVPGFVSYYYDDDENPSMCTGNITLLRPGDDNRCYELENKINAYIDLCELEKKPGKPEIYLVEEKGMGHTLKPHAINDDSFIKNLDLHYGYGFEQFHNELIKRFQTEKKGLILFHGKPGTGKTYYIRHLLNCMKANKKIVIYMPPNMVDNLVNPGFFTFLTKEIARYSANGYFCVLLIEDAEPLLAQRVSDVRIQGISNLLNMTDGLLNDILNLQIICTFNVDLKMLDKALLRPGRLLARKEFGPIPALDANILARQLGINHHFTRPTTIAKIYSFLKNKGTLRHGVGEQEEER